MYSYLLHTSGIWLVSLIAFRILLHGRVPHAYSRDYLLLTFFTGLVFPFIPTPMLPAPAYDGTGVISMTAVNTLIAQPISSQHAGSNFTQGSYIRLIYWGGVVLSATLLIADCIRVWRLFTKGRRYQVDSWTVIETGKVHTPFSFAGLLFICNRTDYTTTEWEMILQHEGVHRRRKHILDVLMLQVACVMLWFHPLVYLYRYWLRTVHEYEADAVAGTSALDYSLFLLDQSLLGAAPRISVALGRNPVQSRIGMLYRSHKISGKRFFIVFPLVLAFSLCFAASRHAIPVKQGNTCHYRGNTIEFYPPQKPDNYMRRDEHTGRLVRTAISWPMPPIRLNGDSIYNGVHTNALIPSTVADRRNGLLAYLTDRGSSTFSQLADGDYALLITDIVTDADGRIVYFRNNGIIRIGVGTFPGAEGCNEMVNGLLTDAPPFTPARLNGVAVPALTEHPSLFAGITNQKDFTVRNHQMVWSIARDN